MLRSYFSIFVCIALMLLSGCATRYQDLLRDRDLEIRELNGQISDLRSQNAEFARRTSDAQSQLSEVAQPEEAVEDAELDRVRGDLPGLDVRRKSGRLSIGIENTVTFDSGSAAVKKTADRVLGQVASVLRRDFSGHRIYVEGHTDDDPIRKSKFRSNLHLSAERAEAVASYLVSKCGVPASDVVVVGYGPHEPRINGSSDSAKARNRRVEIVVGDA